MMSNVSRWRQAKPHGLAARLPWLLAPLRQPRHSIRDTELLAVQPMVLYVQPMEQNVTADVVLDILWQRQASHCLPGHLATPDQAQVTPLARTLGEQAVQCVSDAIGRRHDALVDVSAALLETLMALWAACGLAPDEIWIELHKREQLGSLLMQLNQAQAQVPRRLLKPWRVDSTKLP